MKPVLAGAVRFDEALAPKAGVLDVPEGELTEKLNGARAGLAAAAVVALSSAPPSSIPLSSSASSIGGTATGVAGAPKEKRPGLPEDVAEVVVAPKLNGALTAG